MGTRPRVRELGRSKTRLTHLHTPINRFPPGYPIDCPRPSGAGEEAAGRAGWGLAREHCPSGEEEPASLLGPPWM